MALLEYSEDFELDDDGILRDSNSPGNYLIDDDGILRDDYDIHDSGKYASTHWTDSGFGGSKQSAGSSSTLRQFDLQSYPSYDSVSHPLDDDHENISDLEASKDDLSFDGQDGYSGYDENGHERARTPIIDKYNDKSVRSSHSSYNNSLTYDDTENLRRSTDSGKELFDEEYYKQLRELGVLVDGADLVDDKDSLQEFEHLESHVSKDDINFEEKDDGPAFDDYLRATPTPQEEEDHSDSVVPDISRSHIHGHDYQTSNTRPTTATSLRTLSRGSFPEISPEEALELYKENLESRDFGDATSIDFENSSQRTNDDDEIFLITSKISDTPKPAKLRAFQNERDVPSMSPSYGKGVNQRNRSFDQSFERTEREIRNRGPPKQDGRHIEDDSFDVSDYGSRGNTPFSREGSVTPDKRDWRRSGSITPTRPDSVTSQRSSASDRGPKTPVRQPSLGNLSKQNTKQTHSGKSGEKEQNSEKMPPKRLLPKPTAQDESNKNFRVKSKSTTNIAAKFGPVKPTHMSLVDLSHINIDHGDTEHDDLSGSLDKAKVELSSKLKQEFHKRKQATELVQQLQMDYDKLLSKYALAELTIDQLRLGAKITLHSDSPTPSQAMSGTLPGAQQQQMLQLGLNRAVKSPSPFQGSIASPLSQDSLAAELHNERIQEQRYKARSQSDSGLLNGHLGLSESRTQESGAEGVKMGLLFQARSLDDRMESFKTLLEEKQLTHEEKAKVFDQVRTNHERLRHDYLQSKEDYNVLKRSQPNLTDINFDGDKELEGELFRLGMKFDEIHEEIEQSEKEKASERQPFQKKMVDANTSDMSDVNSSDHEGRSVDQMKKKIKGTIAGDDLIKPRENSEFEQKVKQLHEEYSALMDRYRRLKQMAQTPEREEEIDNLVRKLRNICDDEPDIFRMPRELQESHRLTPSNSSAAASSRSSSTNWFNEEIERWEQIHDGDEEARLLGRRRPSEAVSENGPMQNGVRRKEPYASVENQSFTRGRENNPNASMENAHDRSRSHQDMNGDLTRESGLPGSYNFSGSQGSLSSRDSRGRSPREFDRSFDRDSPHLPRPRRHDLRDPRRMDRKKHSMSGSMQSLQDSGISDQENGASGGGPLSNIPGPGKFKEMTKQRNAPDADSGFIGSIVGSEVSQLSARQQQQQQQPSLRLRGPPASPRPNSRQRDSDSSMASARVRNKDRPPSRDSNRSRNRKDQSSQSRDYTDDSYTLTTESEMSFEIPSERRSNRGGRKRGGSLENTIEEEEEGSSISFTTLDESRESHQPFLNLGLHSANRKERPRSKLSQHSRASVRSQDKRSPQKSKQKPAKATKMSDDDLTPRATPNQSFSNSFNRTSELYSSEEETPRPSSLNRSAQKMKPMKAFPIDPRPDSRSKVERPSTPRSKGERTPTPRSGRAETPVKKQDVPKTEIVRQTMKPEVKDMAAGSDSEDTVEESIAETTATRGSTGSDRLKILQDEIGRLREEFQKATNQQRQALQQQLQQPQPLPQQTIQNQDQYFDPTEDPYAFMRGPRRRANSFSGGPSRDWDEWFRYPLQHNADGDIPLGYAAADSYAQRPPPPEVLPEPPRSRQRTRNRRRHRHGGVTIETQTMNGYDSDQSPTRATASTVTDDHLLEYYVPRYYTTGTQQTQPRAPNMQRYSSQPNLAFTTTPPPPPAPPMSTHMPTSSYATPISAGYRTRRQAQQVHTSPQQRLYSFDDLDARDQGQAQPAGYVIVEPQTGQIPRPAPPQYSMRTETCPMCGGSSSHTHGDYIYEVPVERPPMAYMVQGSPRGKPPRPRRRSKSASSRVRHYSPDGRNRAKYIVKEYYTESSSAESEDEVHVRRGRNRGRKGRGRKYRKAHSVSGLHVRARSDYEDDLNRSLNLTEEIDGLTRRMMDTVDGELRRAGRKKEFRSSIW
ncbi:titin homolog isoform X2 [Mytilus trossulus]|uniref:titin homolog isoform X2 n=1 Tax=Mytilus trossulus TaxID=6551 RepID=UPI003005E605